MMEDIGKQLDNAHLVDSSTGEVDFKGVASFLSAVSWGLLVAKAKAGTVAAASKEQSTVKLQFIQILIIAVVTIVVGLV